MRRTPALAPGAARRDRSAGLRPVLVAAALAAAGLGAARAADAPSGVEVGVTLGVDLVVPRHLSGVEVSSHRLSPGFYIGTRIGGLPVGSSTWPLSVEAGHQRIAWADVSYTAASGKVDLRTRGHATYAALKLDAPITESLGLYGKLGLSRNHADGSAAAGVSVVDLDGSRTGLMTAFGVQYQLTQQISLRTELVSFGKASANARAAGLQTGLSYRF